MARFRSPITGKFVSLAAARRWNYPSEAQRIARLSNIKKAQRARRKKPVEKIPTPAPREIAAPVSAPAFVGLPEGPAVPGDEDFFFEQASTFEDVDFDEIGDLDFSRDELFDSLDDFEDVEETDYEGE